MWTGHVSKKFALQSGHDYLIRVQSGDTLPTDSAIHYGFTVGLPTTTVEMVDVNSTNTFSIPANTTKTFTFNVSGYPNSTRLCDNGYISFRTGKSINDLDITSCKITAPNGKVLVAPSKGEYMQKQPIDYNNYLTSYNNIPLNGTWKVTIKASSALSGLKFRIYCQAGHIPGSDGNE